MHVEIASVVYVPEAIQQIVNLGAGDAGNHPDKGRASSHSPREHTEKERGERRRDKDGGDQSPIVEYVRKSSRCVGRRNRYQDAPTVAILPTLR